ncbi:MAG: tetratricopeptide repeat protein [Gemmatimonadota bacterium]
MGGLARRELGIRCLVFLAPLVVYAHSLGNPFQYDDMHSIVDNASVRSLRSVPSFFVDATTFSGDPSIAMYRPLLLVTYAINHAVSGYAVWSYHAVNVLLHAGCALLVFLSGRALGLSAGQAGLAGLLFGIHPVNSEAVNYISSRSEILAGLFVLVGLWLHLRPHCSIWLALGIAAAYAAGLGAKSVAVALPALCLAYDLLFRRGGLRRRLPTYALLAGVTALYLLVAGHFLRAAAIGSPVRQYNAQLWSQAKALTYYLQLLVVPRDLSVDHQFLISESLWDPFAASSALALLSAALLIGRRPAAHPEVAFLGLWWLISLAPASLVPLHVLVNEHRLYLASAAFCLGLALAARQLLAAAGGRRWQGIAVGLLAVLALLAAQRTRVWATESALWADAAAKAPLMARPLIMLAEAQARDGQARTAMRTMEQALSRDPRYGAGYELLGRLHREAGELAPAEAWLRRGLAADSTRDGLWGELGTVVAQQEPPRLELARRALARAVRLAPESPAYRDNLGNVLQFLQRPAEALAQHRLALALAPGDPRILLNLGNAHQMLGELDSALQYYRQALAGDSTFAGAWANLGSALEREGQRGRALEAYARAAALEPGYGPLLEDRRRILESGP